MSKNDGGPAFPTEPNTQPGFYAHHGMSLRDYFAGQALIGLCGAIYAGGDAFRALDRARRGQNMADYIAAIAYDQANALLKVRGE